VVKVSSTTPYCKGLQAAKYSLIFPPFLQNNIFSNITDHNKRVQEMFWINVMPEFCLIR
jgi:hypothetical protein